MALHSLVLSEFTQLKEGTRRGGNCGIFQKRGEERKNTEDRCPHINCLSLKQDTYKIYSSCPLFLQTQDMPCSVNDSVTLRCVTKTGLMPGPQNKDK